MATKKSHLLGLPMQMMLGLALGVVVGMFVSSDFAVTYLKPLGDLFIRLIRMVVVPLVFPTSPSWAVLPSRRSFASWQRPPSP